MWSTIPIVKIEHKEEGLSENRLPQSSHRAEAKQHWEKLSIIQKLPTLGSIYVCYFISRSSWEAWVATNKFKQYEEVIRCLPGMEHRLAQTQTCTQPNSLRRAQGLVFSIGIGRLITHSSCRLSLLWKEACGACLSRINCYSFNTEKWWFS